jgi:hypothetical protein
MSLSHLAFDRYRNVTDGQTDRIAMAIARLQHSVLAARKNRYTDFDETRNGVQHHMLRSSAALL